MEAVKTEVLNLTAGDVLVVTVDTSNMPPLRANQLVQQIKTTHPLVEQARKNGNLVIVTSSQVKAEVLSYTPDDQVVFYVDIGNMTPTKAREYLERVRDNLSTTIPPEQTLIVAKGNKVEVQPKVVDSAVHFHCDFALGINDDVYASREIADAHIRKAIKGCDLDYTLEELLEHGLIQFFDYEVNIITTMPGEE